MSDAGSRDAGSRYAMANGGEVKTMYFGNASFANGGKCSRCTGSGKEPGGDSYGYGPFETAQEAADALNARGNPAPGETRSIWPVKTEPDT